MKWDEKRTKTGNEVIQKGGGRKVKEKRIMGERKMDVVIKMEGE